MKKNDYMFYKDFLKKCCYDDKKILIAKINGSYLIGPKIDKCFDANSFYKRLSSNCIYSLKVYKKVSKKQSLVLINKYYSKLKSNEVAEVFNSGEFIIYKILKVPGENNE